MSKAAKPKRKPRTKPATPPLEVLRQAEVLPVKYIPLVLPVFTEPGLRWALFNRDKNGLAQSGAIVQNGRRVTLKPKPLAAWFEAGGGDSMNHGVLKA